MNFFLIDKIPKIDGGLWNYALIRERNKLKIVELYYNNYDKPCGYSYLDLDNLKDLFLVILDIYLQLKYGHLWDEDEIMANKSDLHQ